MTLILKYEVEVWLLELHYRGLRMILAATWHSSAATSPMIHDDPASVNNLRTRTGFQWRVVTYTVWTYNKLSSAQSLATSLLTRINTCFQDIQREFYGGRVRRSSMTATCTTRTRPHIALWLERPVHRHTGDMAGPEASVSPLLSWEQVTVHFWPATFTALDDNSLQCAHTAVATTRRRSIFYFAARNTRGRDHQPTTSIQPTLDACGPFWSRSGPWHAPPRPGMRERE